jgi:lipoic acid synthetase
VVKGPPAPPRPDEPRAVAEAAARLLLRYVVITSVTRDDLSDGGAAQFAATVQAVRAVLGHALIEVLTPDFQGSADALDAVLSAGPDVFNHNVETVPRLYPVVRPQADYHRSLDLLRRVSQRNGDRKSETGNRPAAVEGIRHPAWRSPGETVPIVTKSGLMVGLGETPEEVTAVMRDLRDAGCQVLTIGQYLQPSASHIGVARYVPPDEFAAWRREGKAMGFAAVSAGPFVRSSYQAGEVFGSI